VTESVKIVVFARLNEAQLTRIRALSPNLDVRYVGEGLCIRENRVFLSIPAEDAAAQLRPLLSDAEVVLGYPGDFTPPYPTPKLKWVQLLGAGTNHLHKTGLWRSHVTVTNASGVHAVAMSEYALMCMLMLTNDAWRLFRQQQAHTWERWHRPILAGRSVGILGYGAIGSEVARLCAAFNMTVRALDITFPAHRLNIGYLSEVYPPQQLRHMLALSDYVVNCLPLTESTTHILGADAIATMPSGSFIISLSRGPIVDFSALTVALKNEHLGGAALDVTEPEPLPADSPLWDMPNVIISPHMSGIFQTYMDRLTDLFCQNLRFYLGGYPLVNVVDKGAGY